MEGEEMKKVLEVHAQGEFKQYLMLSEARYIGNMCKAWGEITVKAVEISKVQYKIFFGK